MKAEIRTIFKIAWAIALCTGVMGAMFGVTQLGMYLGKVSLISPSLAAGAPLIVSGTLAAWLSDAAQS